MTLGRIAFLGSGETSLAGGRIFEALARLIPDPLHVSNVMGRVYLAYALNESVFFTYNSKSSQLCKAFSSITSIPLAQSHV